MSTISYLLGLINSPVGIGIFAGGLTMVYLTLMSINSHLPPILILGLVVGYMVYYLQTNCPIQDHSQALTQSQSPSPSTTTTITTS